MRFQQGGVGQAVSPNAAYFKL
ncbi:hypothetical protein SBA4_7760003 [Candidatus Sulfopaludibacter sp. SbA4]|nr:hypothetical protein SBA4_7760003 [Candidatus Sulfopaludibacter sp. SbA4]